MRTRHTALAISGTAILALGLSACSGSTGDPDGSDGDATIGDDQSVGAMEDFGVGDTFEATEPVTFGLMYRDHPNYPVQDDWSILTHLDEDHGVTFDMQTIPLSDWEQKRALLISSGDAADIIPSTYVADVQALTAGGALLPVSDYLDYMPNFQDKIEKWGLEEDLDRTRNADGDFFVLPGLLEQAKPDYTIAIRSDLWEEAGLEDPETWEEFAEQLAIIQQENPDLDYPYTERWSINGPMEATLQAAAGNFGTEAGWGFGDGVTWNGSEFEYTGAQDGYKDLVTYFHGLVEDGLLDPAGLTQDDDAARAKLTTGKVAALGSNSQEINVYRQGLEETGNDEAELRNIIVPGGPAGNMMDATTGGRFESGIAISSAAADKPYFEALLQYIDWQYFGDEGLEFAKWGVEGETFTRDGDARTLEAGIDWNGVNPQAGDDPKQLNTDFGYYNGVWSLSHGSTTDLLLSMLTDEVADFQNTMNAEKEIADAGPAMPLSDLQREEISITQTNLQDIAMTATAQFIKGDRPLDEWDAYIEELRATGMDEFVATVNEAAGTGS
ncbi:extracellular solute-binding protein [Microbacterium sp. G2-8]|uniref:extracellular solute-binding protein n=1 Tax=Microbacterium sp. G2-8 TaxID=2842454 RepID=UPI001C89AB9A|nr:extracellular solute-binding protein [Microbacterium sp. G2-8]